MSDKLPTLATLADLEAENTNLRRGLLEQQRELQDTRFRSASNQQIAKNLEKQLVRAKEELTGHQLREQGTIDKWRTRNQTLATELQLAQVGLTSGCGCPIGECQKRGTDEGSCWLQWAEAHVLRRMANMRIGDLQNASRHPSRFRQAREVSGKIAPRLASPEPAPDATGLVREPGIEDYGSESGSS